MADIHIERAHKLGLLEARQAALQWAAQVKEEFGMACTYEEGQTGDQVHFTRAGVRGTLQVSADRFALDAQLGFLLGAFKGRIESEIVGRLDALIKKKPAPTKKAPAK